MRASDRHLSAQELAFLKEAYKKNEPREHGGHTLDLVNSAIAKRFGATNPRKFNADFEREFREVSTALEEQKEVMTQAFVDGERARLRARLIGSAQSSRARAQQARSLALRPVTATGSRGRSPLAAGPLLPHDASLNAEPSFGARRKVLLNELHRVNCALRAAALDPDKVRPDVWATPAKQEPELQRRRHGSRSRSRRRREQGSGGGYQTRLKARSELEKKAQRILPHEAHARHVLNRFSSTAQSNFGPPDRKRGSVYAMDAADPLLQVYKRRDGMMNDYADALARAPDLRAIF